MSEAEKLFGDEHVRRYRETDGEVGHIWKRGSKILLLTTTGRRSGESRTTPLIYEDAGEGAYVIVASKGGAPEYPAGTASSTRARPAGVMSRGAPRSATSRASRSSRSSGSTSASSGRASRWRCTTGRPIRKTSSSSRARRCFWGGYTADETAIRNRAGVEEETTEPEQAYTPFRRRKPVRYRDGWLPD